MALVLDVLTHLDERSAAETSRQLKHHFEEGGHDAGETFGTNMLEGIMAGFHGGEFESLGGIFESAGMVGKATSSGEAIGAAFAGGIVVAAGAALVDLGVKVGETFENINRQIELHTAASGKALDDLKSHADALVGSLDSSTANLGTDMATLATRLQMGPGAALDQLTQHVEMLRDRMGDFNTGALAGALHNMGVSGADADNALASLVATAQRSDVPLSELVNNLAANSDLFKDLHLTAGQAANMLGEIGAKGVPATTAIMGLQMGMKAAKTQGEDFNTFIRRISDSLDYYAKKGDEASAEQLSLAVGGPRKWADLQTAAHAYLDTVQQGAGAFAANSQQLDELQKNTRNLHNQWQLVENRIKAALAPVALNVVDDISGKMDGFIGWLTAHQQDLEKFFSAGITAVETVVEDIGKLAALLGRHPQLIRDVAIAFGTWEAIRGVDAVLTGLEAVGAWLAAEPAAAATAGAAMTAMGAETAAGGAVGAAGLVPVTTELTTITTEAPAAGAAIAAAGAAGEAGLSGLAATLGIIAADMITLGATLAMPLLTAGDAPGSTKDNANDKQIAGNRYFKEHGKMPDGYQQWLQGTGPMPKDLAGDYHPGEKPGSGPPGGPAPQRPGTGVFAPGQGPDVGPRAAPVLPGAPVASGPAGDTGGPPSDLLTPADLDPKKGLPQAPELPMPAGYGAAPRPGETGELYEAEQRVLEERHGVDETRARLDQLEHDNNATAADIQKARNDVLKATKDQNAAELQLYRAQTEQLNKHSSEMGELGAKIDKDFGVSKGLAGIADNITKFLGNLMMAGPLAALNQIVEQSGVRQNAPGAGGLIGMGGVSGMFGPQFMAGGAGAGAGGYPVGPFGGYPGIKGALGAATGANGIPGVGGAGFAGIAMPAGDSMTYTTGALAGLGLSPLAQNPAGGGSPEIPGWVQDFVHTYGGGDLTAGSTPHGSLHGNAGGPDYAVDVMGPKEQQDALAKFLEANPQLSAMMIHQSQITGEDFGIAGGQNVPKGTYFTTPGGTYADEGPMVHWAPAIRPDMAAGTGPQPAGGHAANWDATHAGEAGSWDANTGNGYYGGLQFTQQSWAAAGGTRFAPSANLATEEQQKTVADRLLQMQGPGAWPHTFVPNTPGAAPSGFQPRGTDTIPAMLSPGEEVAQTSAVQKYGAGTYNAMNKGLVDPTSIRYLSGGTEGPLEPGQTQGPTQIGGGAASAGYGSGMPGGGGGVAGAATSAIGGAAPSAGAGGGMSAIGGGLAAGAGAGAATLGIGLAAQIAMQEAQRAIQYAGALGGIAAGGLMETFLPAGASQLAQNSWLTKIAGGLMGAQPQIPNMAGKSQNKSPKGVSGMGPDPERPPGLDPAGVVPPRSQPTPESVTQGAQAPPQGESHRINSGEPGGNNGPVVHIQEYHAHDDPNAAGQDIARHAAASMAPSRGTSQWS